ncbi:MAG: hypothetical protein IKJ09_05875 [Bacteroidaceae bacterium]|nr:hypothetical protein [Bacteroidaceae bacterium]
MDSNKYIYATLLSTPKYLQGVKALYKSLCKYGKSKHPFVCFCSKDVPQYCIEELKWYGIECVCLPSYSLSTSLLEQVKTNKINHWIFTFDKLFLFGMVQYEKILFLDADMIVLDEISELFDKPHMSAVYAGHFKFPDWVRLNSGCMVLIPNKEVEKGLFDSIYSTINERTALGYDCGDQDVINYYYSTWPNDYELHLSEDYNVFFDWVPEYISKTNSKPKIVHFIGGFKPWMHRTYWREFAYIFRLIKDQRKCLGVYFKYKMLLCKIKFTDKLMKFRSLLKK